MVKSYKTHSFINGLRFSCVNTIKECKWKIFLSFALILVAICTGVFFAIKYNNSYSLGQLQEIDLGNFYMGVTASSSAFFSRCLSLLVNVAVLCVLALSSYLLPFAIVLFAYRGYLFGLNCALIFIFYGVGGVITGIVIILPCQLLTLFVLVMFYFIFQKLNKNCKRFGNTDCNRLVFIIVCLVILLLLNLAETLLLWLLNGKVIMVI